MATKSKTEVKSEEVLVLRAGPLKDGIFKDLAECTTIAQGNDVAEEEDIYIIGGAARTKDDRLVMFSPCVGSFKVELSQQQLEDAITFRLQGLEILYVGGYFYVPAGLGQVIPLIPLKLNRLEG